MFDLKQTWHKPRIPIKEILRLALKYDDFDNKDTDDVNYH